MNKQRTSGPPPGLQNLGNSCYANSMLQSLIACDQFAEALIKHTKIEFKNVPDEAIDGFYLAEELRNLFVDMKMVTGHPSKRIVVNPIGFINILRKYVKSIDNPMAPQDIHEILVELLERMNAYSKVNSPLKDVLRGGKMRELSRCVSCKHCWASPALWQNAQDYVCMMLPLPQRRGIDSATLLQQYLSPEFVDGWKCEKCHEMTRVEKRVQLKCTPRMLMLCVPFLGYEGVSQVTVRPSYSFSVLQPAINRIPSSEFKDNDDRTGVVSSKYVLTSLVRHWGSSGRGHYVAYVRYGDQWYECDDDQVEKVEWKFVEKGAGGRIYLMIYQEVDFDAM